MGSSEFPTVPDAIQWGALRGYHHVVVARIPSDIRIREIRTWLYTNEYHGAYYRWCARQDDIVVHVWCFLTPDIAFDFKMRFG